VTLECNYRSTAPILAVANAVALQDTRGYPSDCGRARRGVEPELIEPRDESAQAGEVCERVMAAREEGMELRAQAVLSAPAMTRPARARAHQARDPVREVRRSAVPRRRAREGLRALLRLTDNPSDEISWFRLLQLLDGVGPIRARRMLEAMRGPDGGPPS